MRLRIFSGKTVPEAMDQVRAALGLDAIIVNIDHGGRGRPARITAAVESPATVDPAWDHLVAAPDAASHAAIDAQELDVVLHYHGLPAPVVAKLREGVSDRTGHPAEAFVGALDQLIRFRPLDIRATQRVMLIGQPGHGKTLNCARLAAQARMAERAARVITLDSAAAGALAQLEAFCAPLDVPVSAVDDLWSLPAILATPFEGLTIVDTAGVNPYALDDVEHLARAIGRAAAEPIWVLGAGLDAMEAAELAEIFASLGVKRFIASRIDGSRRLGAVITAALRSGLALAGFAASPYLGEPLLDANAVRLADYLLNKPDPAHVARMKERRAS